MWQQILSEIQNADYKTLARGISLIENEVDGYEQFLQQLPAGKAPITGITGPPGAGKSTLVDALLQEWVSAGKKVGVLCIDPSSPFNLGALLGDRIRMSEWYNHPNVFIRSLATRGALGGLHPHILEITALLQSACFDHIIIETVGVGQSEIEITGLADTTVVVIVPEAGDEVQTMKAGLMEIADIFVVNKSDRPDADQFVKNLRLMLAPAFQQTKWEVPVLKTIATTKTGLPELAAMIALHQEQQILSNRRSWLMAERAYKLIQKHRMKDISKSNLLSALELASKEPGFNLFSFIQKYK
jgi:LAO/AO transport system kinase